MDFGFNLIKQAIMYSNHQHRSFVSHSSHGKILGTALWLLDSTVHLLGSIPEFHQPTRQLRFLLLYNSIFGLEKYYPFGFTYRLSESYHSI